jgi:protein-S-isoprenylcysteine O-methyltransferase Ste14
MNDLNRKALDGLLQFLIVLALLIFLPAWTLRYWQGWAFLAVFSASILAVTLHVMKNDPKLLERRMRAGPGAEKEGIQKTIQALTATAFVATIVIPGLDHRFAWSAVPACVSIGGNLLVALGVLIIFFVFKANTYASGIVEVAEEQRVVSTGPYGVIRHPMYFGALVMIVGVPLALGSWWGLGMVIPFSLLMAWRLLDEESFLAKNLAGYSEYQKKVGYRILPFIW